MKKIFALILVVALMISFSGIQAQTTISLGARAGLSFANLSFDPDVSSGVTKSSRTGFKIGGLAEIQFAPMVAVQVEPMFATGGCELSGQGGKDTYKLSFLEIPVLLKIKIPISKSPVEPYVFAGPNLAFVLSSKDVLELNGQPSQESDNKDFTSSTAFALDFGGGAGFKVNSQTTILLDLRYSLGLSNLLNDKGKQNSGNNQSIKANAFQVVAGVMFALK